MIPKRLSAYASSLLDLVFPPVCVGCGGAGSLFCDRCAQMAEPISHPICPRCGQPQADSFICPNCRAQSRTGLTMARAAAVHEEPLRSAIHALKYEGVTELAPSLARYLVAALRSAEWAPIVDGLDTVIAVPLHTARRTQRGYNQSELLAERLCAACELPLETGWIERHRDTRPQVGLSAAERRSNVADSFTASPAMAGKCILLVDDVYTTGATLWSCADAAKQAGADAVYALTVARPRLSGDRSPA